MIVISHPTRRGCRPDRQRPRSGSARTSGSRRGSSGCGKRARRSGTRRACQRQRQEKLVREMRIHRRAGREVAPHLLHGALRDHLSAYPDRAGCLARNPVPLMPARRNVRHRPGRAVKARPHWRSVIWARRVALASQSDNAAPSHGWRRRCSSRGIDTGQAAEPMSAPASVQPRRLRARLRNHPAR